MIFKEWLFSKRTWRRTALATAIGIAGPSIALISGSSPLGSASFLKYTSLMAVMYVSSIQQAMQRLHVDGPSGTGLLYARTRVRLSQIVLTKLFVEWLVTAICLAVPAALVLTGESFEFIATGGAFLLLSVAIVISWILFLVALFPQGTQLISLGFGLLAVYLGSASVTPVSALQLGTILPMARAIFGIREIAEGVTPSFLGFVQLGVWMVFMIPLLSWAYKRHILAPFK